MKIVLDKEESEKFFHNAMCNIGGIMSDYGLEFNYKESDYNKAKMSLQKKMHEGTIKSGTICTEDVFMEILRIGGKLKFIDHEGDGLYTKSITLKDVHDRVQKTPLNHLTDMIEELDDAGTADQILQTVFFEEIVFG